MGLKKISLFSLLVVVLIGLPGTGMGEAGDKDSVFPSYGAGPVEVRLYTDYFCPPCREMESEAEAILKTHVRKGAIRLILVDIPIGKRTPLYARNFLYAIKENNELDHALRVRNILQNAAAGKKVKTQEQIETLFREKGIAFRVWDPKPVFNRYNDLIRADKIKGTPACVVIKDGQKKIYESDREILDALKSLP